MKLPKISQSLIKGLFDYLHNEECGLLFRAKYVDKTYMSEPSAAMKLGIYFEYLCTGMLPKSGIVPQPERTLKGQLTEAYQRVIQSAALFKKTIAYYKIKVLSVGLYLNTNEADGLLDILAEWNGKVVIIDLKFSGLLDDKWNELGWETKSLATKDSIMIQGVHYKMLVKDVLGKDVDFFYFVFNSADADDMKIIKQVVDEDKIAAHRVVISEVKQRLAETIKNGFIPRPAYRKCRKCPIYDTCKSRAEVPTIEEVQY